MKARLDYRSSTEREWGDKTVFVLHLSPETEDDTVSLRQLQKHLGAEVMEIVADTVFHTDPMQELSYLIREKVMFRP